MIVIRIIGLVEGSPTPFDGQYLKEYDPSRDGYDPDGELMGAHIVTTPNIQEAMKLNDVIEGKEVWAKIDAREPVRWDGRPNRPLTAFHVVMEPA